MLVCECKPDRYLAAFQPIHKANTHALTFSSQPASSVLHYVAMWFIFAAEIQSVLKNSHENSKVCMCSFHETELKWFSILTEQNFPSLTHSRTAFFSCSPGICKQWVFNIHIPDVCVLVVSPGFNYAFMSFMILCCIVPANEIQVSVTSHLYAADLYPFSASVVGCCYGISVASSAFAKLALV